jgi:DNA repair exonuclease SbcCD ATPase subunit
MNARRLLPLIFMMLATSAQAFSDDDARKAILELRQRLSTVQSELGARLDTAQRNQLEMANQNDSLRQEIARLRGQVESLTNEVATLQKRNRDLYTDLDARIKKFEPSSMTVDGRSATVERSEQAAYDAALAQFHGGDFRGAIGGSPAVHRALSVERLRSGGAVLHRQRLLRAKRLQVLDRSQPVDRRPLQGLAARARGAAVDCR